MESDKELLKKIQDVCNLLDEIEKINETNLQRCSDVDMAISDLEHQIESEDLKTNEILGIYTEFKKLRKIRRAIKNEIEILKVYSDNKNKLIYPEQRPFFINSMSVKLKTLNKPYNNRIYSDEELDTIKHGNLTNDEKTKIASKNVKGSVKIDLQELEKEYIKGKTQRELAIMFNCTQPTINYYIKKIKKGRRK